MNFNGLGVASTPVAYIVCTYPAKPPAPIWIAVTKTTITLSWTPPTSDGGCQILSYSILMDDGAGGTLTEVDAASVNNLPTLRSYQITSFASSDTSKTFRFQLRATNTIGSTDSDEISHVLAAVPDQPATSPTLNLDGTRTRAIRADYAAFTTSMNGGSAVLSYEL